MNYLYIGYYVDEMAFNQIVNRKINDMSPARQKFEFNLIRGLQEQLGNHVDYLSYVPTGPGLELPAQTKLGEAKISHILINKGSVSSLLRAKKEFAEYMRRYTDEELRRLCVIMYAVNPVFMIPLMKLRKRYGIKLITICSEVPMLRRGNSFKARCKKKALILFNEKFDGYVLFSKAMKNAMNIGNKPTFVMEGIASELVGRPSGGKKNIVMYAGGLAKDNNVALLLDACRQISELDELWICGIGDDQPVVKKAALEDKRIKYYGRISNDKVLELEKKAKVLVNLRSPEAELTKYSFPSKILEYIASGSLVMSTKLEGIPEEYFEYIVPVEVSDKDNLIRSIRYIFSMTDSTYISKCAAAQIYISNQKNYFQQTARLVKFTKSVSLLEQEI